jgi:pentatricopeptide repeat protein
VLHRETGRLDETTAKLGGLLSSDQTARACELSGIVATTAVEESDLETVATLEEVNTQAGTDLHSPLLTSVPDEGTFDDLASPKSPVSRPAEYLARPEASPTPHQKSFEPNSLAKGALIKRPVIYNIHALPTGRLLELEKQCHRNAQKGLLNHPLVIAGLLPRLGRMDAVSLERLEQLYLMGYEAVEAIQQPPDYQVETWIKLEDAMLTTMASRGQLDRVAHHRDRLIQGGFAPSADSYATMILNAKDTTDDATVAIELFEESRRLGVEPNTYLFNNLLSRLSKARRTKAALECFQEMKALGITATAVTYGALINAVSLRHVWNFQILIPFPKTVLQDRRCFDGQDLV